MENYPSNSRNLRDEPKEPKKIERVVSGKVTLRKKPLGKRFLETFVGGDDAGSVWGYIVTDVLVPAAKDMVSDAVYQGIERILFGDVRNRVGGSRSFRHDSGGHIKYNRFAPQQSPVSRREDPRRPLSRQARATHDFDEIVLSTKVEADEVIEQMFELLATYDAVTVSDLYGMLGQTGNFTDERWGWTDLRGAGSTRIKGGYLLDLPRPEPLD